MLSIAVDLAPGLEGTVSVGRPLVDVLDLDGRAIRTLPPDDACAVVVCFEVGGTDDPRFAEGWTLRVEAQALHGGPWIAIGTAAGQVTSRAGGVSTIRARLPVFGASLLVRPGVYALRVVLSHVAADGLHDITGEISGLVVDAAAAGALAAPIAANDLKLVLARAAVHGTVPHVAVRAPPSPGRRADERQPPVAVPAPRPPSPPQPPSPPRAPYPPQEPDAPRAEAPVPAPAPPAAPRSAPARARRWQLAAFTVTAAVLAAPLLVKWLFGWLVSDVDAPARADDDVQSTVFAPASARPSTAFLVQVFVHPAADADAARALATEFDVGATRRAYRTLGARLRRGCTIDVKLEMPGLELDDPVGTLVWNGRAEAVQFGVRVPADAEPGTVLGTVALACDSVPLGRITFRLEVAQAPEPAAPEPQGETAHRYRFAFISYSSEDRQQVVERVQALSAVDLDFFQDFWSMRAGTEWVPAIAAALDRCDLFLLFWSSNAKRSAEVRKEVARALTRQSSSEHALPDIRPVILEGPPVVEPWEELRHLQFNDPLVYLLPRRR